MIMNVKKMTRLIQLMDLNGANINQSIFDFIKEDWIFAKTFQI